MSEVADEIKHRLDTVDFIQSYLTLKKAGNNWKGLCPFHTEKTPSFMVSRDKQIFKCFGCGESGDIFAFLMKIENLAFPEALELLASRAGVVLPKKPGFTPGQTRPDQPSKSRLQAVNQQAAKFFYTLLTKHWSGQEALAYLRSRQVNDQSILQYRLGYAPLKPILRPWLVRQGFSEDEVKLAGSPDRFYHRVMFPLLDVMGNVIGFSGRALRADQEPKYLHTAQTALFHKSRYLYGLHQARLAIKSQGRVIVVEGQLDTILSAQAGVEEVVAPSGTALTDDQLRLLTRYTDNIFLAFDQDQAGQKAAEEAALRATRHGLTVKIISLPQGFKDPSELVGQDPALWPKATNSANHLIAWVLQSVDYRLPLKVEDKKNLARRFLPILAQMTDRIEQSHWVGVVSQRLGVRPESVIEMMARYSPYKTGQAVPSSSARSLTVREQLLALLEKLPHRQSEQPALYRDLKSWYNQDTAELVLLYDYLHQQVGGFDVDQEFPAALARYHEAEREQTKHYFAEAIASAESAGDRQKAKELVLKLMEELKNHIPPKKTNHLNITNS